MEIYNSELKSYIDTLTNEKIISAISVASFHKGKSQQYFSGVTRFDEFGCDIRKDTLFDIASLTKVVVTTTLILRLMDEGMFNLQTPLNTILHDFKYPEVTLGQLLTHTSGVCHDDKSYRSLTGKTELRELIMNEPLEYVPGTSVVYSDMAFILLGFVIEYFKGSIQEAAKNEIFEPLGMANTTYCPLEEGFEKNKIVASEYQSDRGQIQGVVHDGKATKLGGISGNAGVFSTASDLIKFCMMILTPDSKVLTDSSKHLLHYNFTKNLGLNRTIGWIQADKANACGDYTSEDYLYHTGFTGTSIYIDFESEDAIVLLTNRVYPTRDNSASVINEIRNNIHNMVLKKLS